MDTTITERLPVEISLAKSFGEREPTAHNRIDAFRKNAFDALSKAGLPNRKVEAWKYSDLRKAFGAPLPVSHRPGSDEIAIGSRAAVLGKDLKATRLTFVNGYFEKSLSDVETLPAGVEVRSACDMDADDAALMSKFLAPTPGENEVVSTLNAAFFADGALIRISTGVELDEPIHLRFLYVGGDAFASISRVFVAVEPGASVTLFETHEAPAACTYHKNTLTHLAVGDRGSVSHVRLSDETSSLMSLSMVSASVGKSADLKTFNVSGKGPFWRHQAHVLFVGEGSSATIAGSTLLAGCEHGDTTIFIDHAVPQCESRELFKTVVDNEATGVFQGKIIVRPDSQKTDGRMMSAALLLSEYASMNNKPELEIFADDVVCAHGATCGQLNPDLLFYLMARGLPKQDAQKVMVQAFLGEATETVSHEGLRAAVSAFVETWLVQR